jgi:ATP-dependent DNA helicase DinG
VIAVSELLRPGGAVAERLGGYEHRPSQRQMADAVAAALADERPLLVEAGTGTGKTLAYLLAAATSGKKVVISTGTRALQEQLARRDLPLVRSITGSAVRAAVLKGTSNYVCRRRLFASSDAASGDDHELDAVLSWVGRTDTGDRAETSLPDDAAIWSRITTGPEGRLVGRCPHFESCFVAGAGRRAERAVLVIANHHLFFADLALRRRHPGARVLGDFDAVIFDEAHQLEDVITEHMAESISSRQLARLSRELDEGSLAGARARAWLERAAAELFARVSAITGDVDRRVEMPAELFVTDEIHDAWLKLDSALEEIAVLCSGDEPEAIAASERATALRGALADVAEPAAGTPRWIEGGGAGLRLCAATTSAADVMGELSDQTGAVVLTSATLTTSRSFAFARRQLGLDRQRADELALDSPFDYAEQARLYIPRDLGDPRDEGFFDAAMSRIDELVALTAGRAFVLFTSHRVLSRAARALAGRLPWTVLVQGAAPRSQLLDRFRAEPGAVLLGTGTFWEGVDVPGDALSLVIIDRLPFAPPDDPVLTSRLAAVAEAGGDPFVDYQVPAAALQLKQGFGRLIRSRRDRGIVAVLDNRLVTRRYGRLLLDSLPPELPRTSVFEQIRRWWTAGTG